jgi:hypothetical protein
MIDYSPRNENWTVTGMTNNIYLLVTKTCYYLVKWLFIVETVILLIPED